MKTKNFSRKLLLNKSTVADLENGQMSKVKGGACTYPLTGCTEARLCCTAGFAATCNSYYPPACATDFTACETGCLPCTA